LIKHFIYSSIVVLSILSAQDKSSISGFVREVETGEPISYANVFISGTSMGTATNSDGYFVFINLSQGEYEVNVSMIGFGLYKETINLGIDESVRLDIRMKEEALQASEIIVSGTRQKFKKSVESSTIILDIRDIRNAPAFVEPDVFRTLQMLPGVQTTSDWSSALYVRGSTPDQNLLMLDGITVYNPYHLGGIFSTFNADAIKEADFRAGGFPARYGGRMGAILNIINREGNTEKVSGSGNISLISSKVLLEGPMPKWRNIKGSWMVSGRRTYFDKIIDMMNIPTEGGKSNNDDEGTLQFPYYFYDYQVKINTDIGDNNRLTYSRFYGRDILKFGFSDSESGDDGNRRQSDFNINWPWGNKTNGLTWRWIATPNVIVKTFLARSEYSFNMNFNGGDEFISPSDSTALDGTFIMDTSSIAWGLRFSDTIEDNTLETEVTWLLSEDHKVTTGFHLKDIDFILAQHFDLTMEALDTTFTPLDMKDSTREISAYIEDKWNLTPSILYQIGVRATHYSLHDSIYVEPRIGLKYNLSDDFSMKLNWGRYHQFLTIANPQDENFRIVDFWMGIPQDKKASKSEHAILGLEYLSYNNILYRIEGYYKDFDNLLTQKEGDFETEESDTTITTNAINEFWDTDAYVYGLELLVKKSSGRFTGWLGYTYAKTFYHTDQFGWFQPVFDRTHTLNMVSNFKVNERLKMSVSVTTSSGNPFTPIMGRIYTFQQNLRDSLNWITSDNYLVGDKNSERHGKYFRIDTGLDFTNRSFFGLFEYDWYLQVINVSNHINVMQYFYRTKTDPNTGNQVGVERRAFPMFPLIITAGVKFEF